MSDVVQIVAMRYTRQPGPGAGAGASTGTDDGVSGAEQLFDHEKLDVYRIARSFFQLVQPMRTRTLPRDTREQLERASLSILTNIAEGAGKTARSDKQRIYEIARGSAGECAGILDTMQLRGFITAAQYSEARALLIRVVQMLSRLCGVPRVVRRP